MSGAFLSDNRTDARERETERRLAEYDEYVAQRCYRWATGLLVAAMVIIAIPQLGLERWHWYLVGVVAIIMTVLAVQMMRHGRISNGLICLLCAFAVLPGWVYLADDVVQVGGTLFEMIATQWKNKFG